MFERYDDRIEGGKALAARLSDYKNRNDVIVLALPRGGVPVAWEVARSLNVPLEVLIVRKLGVPGQEELAFGAIASGGATVFNERLIASLNLTEAMIDRVIFNERKELARRERLYRRTRNRIDLNGRIAIIVDDGLATGATMRAAIAAVTELGPKKIVVGVPVSARETCLDIARRSDAVCVCAVEPEPFYGVGMWYRNFDQVSGDEVRRILTLADARSAVQKARI